MSNNEDMATSGVFIFHDVTATVRNRRYWAIGKYHRQGLWLFYWHEPNGGWVTFKSVDMEFLNDTKRDPRLKALTRFDVPDMFAAWKV